MCGIVGVIGLPQDETLSRILLLLTLQQNRGQQGSGIYLAEFNSGQHPFQLNVPGLIYRLVTTIEETVAHGWPEPVGDIGIGHVRYSTSGSDDVSCLQPQVADIDGDRIVFAFNGNLVSWKQRALDLGLPLGTTDTLFILELLKRSNPALTTIERIRTVCETLKGAFSAVIIWGEHLYAVRDPACFRPLWLGKLNGGWVIASEDGALRHAQAVVVRPIEAGEIIAIGLSGVEEAVILNRQCKRQRCTMEASYFSRPDSSTTSLTKSNGMVDTGTAGWARAPGRLQAVCQLLTALFQWSRPASPPVSESPKNSVSSCASPSIETPLSAGTFWKVAKLPTGTSASSTALIRSWSKVNESWS